MVSQYRVRHLPDRAVTDFLDGYLARSWKVEKSFGRIVDLFVDKVLRPRKLHLFRRQEFHHPRPRSLRIGSRNDPASGEDLTGVAPGIVVMLLARELLVTSSEHRRDPVDTTRGAFVGKLKMVFQSVTILISWYT